VFCMDSTAPIFELVVMENGKGYVKRTANSNIGAVESMQNTPATEILRLGIVLPVIEISKILTFILMRYY